MYKIRAFAIYIVALTVPAWGAVVKHNLKTTYISSFPKTTITLTNNTVTNLDTAQTVSCPAVAPATCTFQADQFIQAHGSSVSENAIALCFLVDGQAVNGQCVTVAVLPSNGDDLVMSISYVGTKISPGNHTVQSQAGLFNNVNPATAAASVSFVTVTYRVYAP